MVYKEKASGGVSLLISMLTRYPEVARANFGPEEMKLVFLVKRAFSPEEMSALRGKLDEHLQTFAWLRGQETPSIILDVCDEEEIALLELHRDLDSISLEEINMVVELLRQEVGELLLTDEREVADEDDLRWQEEMIEEMLEDVRLTRQGQRLCALREGGRVFVFNERGSNSRGSGKG